MGITLSGPGGGGTLVALRPTQRTFSVRVVRQRTLFGKPMHAISLAELASTFVAMATTMLERRIAPPRSAALDYWVQHRSRHDQWSRQLAEHRDALGSSGTSMRARRWDAILPVLQEVLITEPLSRTLACFAAQLEERHISDEFSPLAHSVLVSHIEARHRCLHLIVFGHGLPVEMAVKLNRVRRQVEAYSDSLLASLPDTLNVDAFCFDQEVVRVARAGMEHITTPDRLAVTVSGSWLTMHLHLLTHRLWRSLQLDLDWRTANARHNHRLSQSLLAMFPADAFDSLGVPKSLRKRGIGSGESPESDGKTFDSTANSSTMNLLFKHPPHNRSIRQPNRRRW